MSKTENTPIELPEGFEQVSDGTLAKEWNFDKYPIAQGTVLNKKIVDCVQQGKPAKAPMLLVKVANESYAIWTSAGLKDLYERAKIGDEVFIRYEGLIPMEGGRNDMKKFITAVRPGSGSNAQ